MNTSLSLNIEDLWNQWVKTKDKQIANKLIEHYMYLVDFHVERVASHIPSSYDKEDLRSLGMMGLFDAINKFDPTRNLKFSTYATIRIRGSMIDGLRTEDWLPRTLREQTKEVEQATTELEQTLNRKPTSSEIAEKLNIEREEVETIIANSVYANLISLETTLATDESDSKVDLRSTIEDKETTQPDEHILFEELKEELIEHIKKLNENEQLVLSLFYNDELTLTEIGKILNLTTSRISQIHKRAIYKLKETLSKLN